MKRTKTFRSKVYLSDGPGGYLVEGIADAVGLSPAALVRFCLERGVPLIDCRGGLYVPPSSVEYIAAFAGPLRSALAGSPYKPARIVLPDELAFLKK